MLLAALLTAGSALLGGALAWFARRRPVLLARTRVFAFLIAAAVVILHLLPEVVRALGVASALFIGSGFLLPGLLEVAVRGLAPGMLRARGLAAARVAAEVGFIALFLHSLVEGLTLRAALLTPGSHGDLIFALLAHHVPLTAAVTLPLLELLGTRAAFHRLLALAAAGAGGSFLGSFLPELSREAGSTSMRRATAVMAGVLLHVVWDELRRERGRAPEGVGKAEASAGTG
jgi:zinc transporter ZupT